MVSIEIASASNREVKICKKNCKKICKKMYEKMCIKMCKKMLSAFRQPSVIFKRGKKMGVNSMEVCE